MITEQANLKQLKLDINKPTEIVEQVIAKIQENYKNNFLCNLTEAVALELETELSKIVVLLSKLEKLKLKNSPKNIWWEKLPKIFHPDRREEVINELPHLILLLELAINFLLQPEPNIHFAKNIRLNVKKSICQHEHNPICVFIINQYTNAYHSPSTSLKVLFGLIAAVGIYGSIFTPIYIGSRLYIFSLTDNKEILKVTKKINAKQQELSIIQENIELQSSLNKNYNNQNKNRSELNEISTQLSKLLTQKRAIQQKDLPNLRNQLQELKNLNNQNPVVLIRQVSWAVLAGALGSIVSILIRVEDFQGKRYRDPLIPFFIGGVKPLIGVLFGIFFLALINSQLVVIPGFSDDKGGNKKEYLIFVVAFVVGFSERLAKDVIGKTEEMISGNQAHFDFKVNSLSENRKDGSKVQQTIQNNLEIK